MSAVPRALATVAVFAMACTPSQSATGIAAAEAGCIAIVSVEAPAAEPLCVFGDELATVVADYIMSHAGERPPVSRAGAAVRVSPDLYSALSSHPSVKGRARR